MADALGVGVRHTLREAPQRRRHAAPPLPGLRPCKRSPLQDRPQAASIAELLHRNDRSSSDSTQHAARRPLCTHERELMLAACPSHAAQHSTACAYPTKRRGGGLTRGKRGPRLDEVELVDAELGPDGLCDVEDVVVVGGDDVFVAEVARDRSLGRHHLRLLVALAA